MREGLPKTVTGISERYVSDRMRNESEILSVKEDCGYGMGDAASHISLFDNVITYDVLLYRAIFGIPAGFVGACFLARALI